MADAVTITLPEPPKELNPNGRHHWRAKLRPKQQYRETAKWCGMEMVGDREPVEAAEVWITYYHRTANHRDRDNILASLKPAIDGLVDAGLLADDSDLTYRPIRRETDKGNPRVEVTIEAVDMEDTDE